MNAHRHVHVVDAKRLRLTSSYPLLSRSLAYVSRDSVARNVSQAFLIMIQLEEYRQSSAGG